MPPTEPRGDGGGGRNDLVGGGARPFSKRSNGVELSATATVYGGAASVGSMKAVPSERGGQEGPGPTRRTLVTKTAGGSPSPCAASSVVDRAAEHDISVGDLAEDIVKVEAGRALGQADDGGVMADGSIRGPDGRVLKPPAASDLDLSDFDRMKIAEASVLEVSRTPNLPPTQVGKEGGVVLWRLRACRSGG